MGHSRVAVDGRGKCISVGWHHFLKSIPKIANYYRKLQTISNFICKLIFFMDGTSLFTVHQPLRYKNQIIGKFVSSRLYLQLNMGFKAMNTIQYVIRNVCLKAGFASLFCVAKSTINKNLLKLSYRPN